MRCREAVIIGGCVRWVRAPWCLWRSMVYEINPKLPINALYKFSPKPRASACAFHNNKRTRTHHGKCDHHHQHHFFCCWVCVRWRNRWTWTHGKQSITGRCALNARYNLPMRRSLCLRCERFALGGTLNLFWVVGCKQMLSHAWRMHCACQAHSCSIARGHRSGSINNTISLLSTVHVRTIP